MAILLANGRQYYALPSGLPNVGGKVFTYIAGTTTPQPSYTDASGTTPNTNPVILDARGEANIFWDGVYKVTLTDAAGVVIWTADNIDGRTPVVASILNAYAQKAGAAFTGAITSTANITTTASIGAGAGFTVDANFGFAISALIPTITFDPGDTYSYNRTSNTHTWAVGGAAIVNVTAGGLDVPTAVISSASRELGFRDVPKRTVTVGPDQLVLTDRGGYVYYTGGASTITVPANATVAFPHATLGAIITIINDGSGVVTLARAAGVTMKLGGTGANANRSLAVGGMATLIKVASDTWFISGPGVT